MGKNIAVFLDGTWNISEDYTNVFTLYTLCMGLEIDVEGGVGDSIHASSSAQDTVSDQIRYYDSGVGNGSFWSPALLGGAIGTGLKRNVAQAYLMISREYKPGDRIYIFGFSRGSYTARSVIGLLNNFGVLQEGYIERPKKLKGLLKLLAKPIQFLRDRTELYHAFKAVDVYRDSDTLKESEKKASFEKFRSKYCKTQDSNKDGRKRYSIDIEFAGLFDTVGAMGIPSLLDPLGKGVAELDTLQKPRGFARRNYMPNRIFPQNIKSACHALAIDEHRNHFAPTLWEKPEYYSDTEWQERLEQRWFIGAHSNVGGGYPDNLLSNRPLYWMYENAKARGLTLGEFNLKHDKVHLSEPVSVSYSRLMEIAYNVMGLSHYFRPIDYLTKVASTTNKSKHSEEINDTSQTIDKTVIERIEQDPTYRTRNLMELPENILQKLKQEVLKRDRKAIEQLQIEEVKDDNL